MDIKISNIMKAYSVNTSKKSSKATAKADTPAKNDVFEISSHAKDYQIASKAVGESSDIRIDKVNELKEKINSGTYKINYNKLSNKILGV